MAQGVRCFTSPWRMLSSWVRKFVWTGFHVLGVSEHDGVDVEFDDFGIIFLAFTVALAELAAMFVEHVTVRSWQHLPELCLGDFPSEVHLTGGSA